jgi:hypothetical protein
MIIGWSCGKKHSLVATVTKETAMPPDIPMIGTIIDKMLLRKIKILRAKLFLLAKRRTGGRRTGRENGKPMMRA